MGLESLRNMLGNAAFCIGEVGVVPTTGINNYSMNHPTIIPSSEEKRQTIPPMLECGFCLCLWDGKRGVCNQSVP